MYGEHLLAGKQLGPFDEITAALIMHWSLAQSYCIPAYDLVVSVQDMQFDPQGGRAWRMEQDRDGRKIYFEVDQEPQMNAPLYRSASQVCPLHSKVFP